VVTLAPHRPVMYENNLVCEALIEGEGEGSERSWVLVHGSREHVKDLSEVRLLDAVEKQSEVRVRGSDASTERGSAGGTSGPHQLSSHYCTVLNSNGILPLTRPCISTEDAVTTD
jgi:hypothetical protein